MADISPAPSSPRYRALIQLLRTAEDLWNASRIFFTRWDLSPSQFNVLNLLHGQPDGLSQSELSRLLIMHRSNATGLIDRLERRGLVKRENDASDRRAYRVVLTAAGDAALAQIYPHYFAAAERVWADLPEANVVRLLHELRDLADNAAAVAGTEAAVAEVARADTSVPARFGRKRPTAEGLAGTRANEAAKAGTTTPDSLRTSDL